MARQGAEWHEWVWCVISIVVFIFAIVGPGWFCSGLFVNLHKSLKR